MKKSEFIVKNEQIKKIFEVIYNNFMFFVYKVTNNVLIYK